MSVARGEFRKHLAAYLAEISSQKKPLIIGEREKKEFVIFPYPHETATDLFQIETDLAEKVLMSDYYQGISHLHQDRGDAIHDDLFVS